MPKSRIFDAFVKLCNRPSRRNDANLKIIFFCSFFTKLLAQQPAFLV